MDAFYCLWRLRRFKRELFLPYFLTLCIVEVVVDLDIELAVDEDFGALDIVALNILKAGGHGREITRLTGFIRARVGDVHVVRVVYRTVTAHD